MKVSQNWLEELVDINTNSDELAEKLSIGGFEVESLINCSINVSGVVLGKVLSVEKHFNAEKLSICKVDIGRNDKLQIICGANNVKPNIFVYVATVGAYLNAIDLYIKKAEIRGVASEGMICSLEELGIENSSQGIAIIDSSQVRNLKLGTPAAKLLNLNDYIYDLAITANRPDGMSVTGIAREISSLLETRLKLPVIKELPDIKELKDNQLCSEAIGKDCLYTITFIDNVKGNILSPDWLKDRLEKSGIKSINLIVDITNYVLLEQGQPLHAFDKNKLKNLIGREVFEKDFGIRKAFEHETLLALDGNTYDLNKNITVITCDNKPIAIAGVIGGQETSVCESTTDICLESAVFSPSTIRKSAKAIGIRTESSSRFEKGISPKNTIISASRAINILNEFFETKNINLYSSKISKDADEIIKLRRDRIHKLLGPIREPSNLNNKNLSIKKIKRFLKDDEITEKLSLIGCNLNEKEYGWEVSVIPNRSKDLIREVDLIEEIARLIGYDLFDQNIPNPIKPGKLSPEQKVIRNLKNNFISCGFYEVLTYSLVSENIDRVKISNPLLTETSSLRDNIWEEHLKICNSNFKAGIEACWIFEIGNIFSKNNFIEEEVLGGVLSGNNKFVKWDNIGKLNDINFFEARGKLKEALSTLNIDIKDKPTENIKFLHPGRSSILYIEGKEAGFFGQIHPRLMSDKKLFKNLFIFQLKVKKILEASTRKNKLIPIYKDFPTVPKIERDVNFVFDKKYYVEDIFNEIKKSGGKLLEKVSLIDIYNHEKIGINNVSYTFRISYRDKEKTLMESDIANLHEKIIIHIKDKFDAKIKN